ncbi:5-formyltetrahydrofolate cyclo-ligase [Leucobacter sp. M11]|uniref:5-formyltetrahydrofolate cyclo-ligase n=1 Tax=Leucobacter sp. M11 TaxID=2993565 RepID=UPI002D7F6733|nr:5-formyltetrahydrofolate cyclo-ligase [Leucobacter sp. M11]MEB4614105.1 5-formyltetrahydrofolate cyclo-ligase [Leucobacter sp. M11]
MSDEIDAQKRAMRAEIRERRRNVTSVEAEAHRAGLTQQLITLVSGRGARSVSCYLSAPGEPDTSGFVAWANEQDIRVLFPLSREDGLLDWVVASDEGTEEGLFGLEEVRGEVLSPLAVNDVDLMIIPASAIDRTGNRLGWGRGYFDKTLGSMDNRPPVFGVVYETEFVEHLPTSLHDQPVTGVVTPDQIVYFHERD